MNVEFPVAGSELVFIKISGTPVLDRVQLATMWLQYNLLDLYSNRSV